jgi:hypothetical protein
MARSTLPVSIPTILPLERRKLSGPVPLCFEPFYRLHLRYHFGSRIRSLALAERYAAWASVAEAESLGLRATRRAMMNIGHRHARSNGFYYFDVGWADALPGVADNFPTFGAGGETISGTPRLAQRIDAIMTELVNIRREVVA